MLPMLQLRLSMITGAERVVPIHSPKTETSLSATMPGECDSVRGAIQTVPIHPCDPEALNGGDAMLGWHFLKWSPDGDDPQAANKARDELRDKYPSWQKSPGK
jgi:hypothetical protein